MRLPARLADERHRHLPAVRSLHHRPLLLRHRWLQGAGRGRRPVKLDDLLRNDGMAIDPAEWDACLDLGPLKGSVSMSLVDGYPLPNGYYLNFEYRCPIDMTFIGYRVQRNWYEDGSHKIRTVRMDAWTPAHIARAGALIQVEVLIYPEDWA